MLQGHFRKFIKSGPLKPGASFRVIRCTRFSLLMWFLPSKTPTRNHMFQIKKMGSRSSRIRKKKIKIPHTLVCVRTNQNERDGDRDSRESRGIYGGRRTADGGCYRCHYRRPETRNERDREKTGGGWWCSS
ncbi:hypothetical protein L1887_07243 [Cichorium endivia]|nr:hypothetical protein L1887_07243 [Cichorium endivia]